MKFKEIQDNYYEYSKKTSEVVRNLGFAGIALIWVFRTEINGNLTISPDLYWAGGLLVVGLSLDLLHCIVPTAIWGIYKERLRNAGVSEEEEIYPARQINWPANIFFWGKIIAIVCAYYVLLKFLWERLT